MRENKYDDPRFFEAYGRFLRSVEGLSAAGEWHALQKLLPDFAGARVLDIGCGYGWHCIYAAQQGARYVLGIDISQKMLAVAREKTESELRSNLYGSALAETIGSASAEAISELRSNFHASASAEAIGSHVEYRLLAMEDMDFPPGSFDVVISSLAFHYTPDFAGMCRRVARCLAPGGDFVFSVEHPIFTAHGSQDWAYGPDGRPQHWPVDRYFDEGPRHTQFLGQPVVKYHRTLTTCLAALAQAGLDVKQVVEPQPPAHMLEDDSEMQNELRRPMMLLVAARKAM